MIETFIFTGGCIVGLILGYILGHILGKSLGRRIGEASGFERGLRAKNRQNEASLFEYRSKFDRYQCSRKMLVCRSWDVESLELAATFYVEMMGRSLLDLLLENKVLKPYIVSKEPHQEGEIWTVGLSIYCAADPIGMEFDGLPYIRKGCPKIKNND